MQLLGALPPKRSRVRGRCTSALCLMAAGLLPAAGVTGAVPRASAQILRGTVLEDSSRAPIAAAEVRLIAAGGRSVGGGARADDGGRFVLRAPRAGRYAIEARRIGYQPKVVPGVELDARMELDIEIALVPAPTLLPPTTSAESPERRPFWHDGFEHRRRLGLGVYFTRDDLERRGQPKLTEFLRGVAGVDLSSGRSRPTPMMTRSSSARRCFAVLFMDGFLMNRSDDPPEIVRTVFESIPTTTVEAVEVYKGRSELPAEFGSPDVRCGAIVVWTRRGQLRAKTTPAP